MHNRRQLITSAAALGLAAAAPRLANAAAPTGEAAKMYSFFDRSMAEAFRRSPELPTGLGIDKGDLAWTKSELSDGSLTARDENKAINARRLKELEEENRRLKHLVADLSLDREALKSVIRKNGWSL